MLISSGLTTYAFGLVALAVVQAMIPKRQPSTWVTLCELGVAMVFLAVALFIAPKAEGEIPAPPD